MKWLLIEATCVYLITFFVTIWFFFFTFYKSFCKFHKLLNSYWNRLQFINVISIPWISAKNLNRKVQHACIHVYSLISLYYVLETQSIPYQTHSDAFRSSHTILYSVYDIWHNLVTVTLKFHPSFTLVSLSYHLYFFTYYFTHSSTYKFYCC